MSNNIQIFGTFESVGNLPLLGPKDLEKLIGKGLSIDPITGEIISESTNVISISDTPPTDENVEVWLCEGGESEEFQGLNIPEKLANALSSIETLTNKVSSIERIFTGGINAGGPEDTFEGYFAKQTAVKPEYTEPEPEPPQDVIGIMEGNYDNVREIEPIGTEDLLKPNVSSIRIKRGTVSELTKLVSMDGALYYAADVNKLYIGYNGKWRQLVAGDGGGDPEPPIDPEDPNEELMKPLKQLTFIAEPEEGQAEGKNYVITLNNKGKFVVRDETIVNAPAQKLNPDYKTGIYLQGLYFSNIYAGGYVINSLDQKVGKQDAPCSHNFIEIYNDTNSPINLEGTSIQYSEGGNNASAWQVIPLSGVVPSKHSYLIRGAKLADSAFVQLDTYDIDCPTLYLSDEKFKLYFTSKIDACTSANPSNPLATSKNYNDIVFDNGYIDFFSATNGGLNVSIDAIEGAAYNKLVNKSCVVRKYTADYVQGFTKLKTFSTSKDFIEVRYDIDFEAEPAVDTYKPSSTHDGHKTLFYNKSKVNNNKPTTIAISLGLIPSTRCFNWTSKGYYNEYLYYRLKDDVNPGKWIKLESIKTLGNPDVASGNLDSLYKRIIVNGADGIKYTAHKQILRNLTPGVYEYYCGREGNYSEVYEFEVKTIGFDEPFDFVQVTDQQGWDAEEYIPWQMSAEFIHDVENDKNQSIPSTGNKIIDFYINTGDISQNGVRPGEWINYYEFAQHALGSTPCMTTVGNNDLCPTPGQLTGKNYPLSFEYFNTYEYDPQNIPWVDSSDITQGTMKSVYSYDYGCAHFICLNSNNYLDTQIPWFRKDIELAKARQQPPKYFIVLIHDSPFNIISEGASVRNNRSNDASNTNISKRYLWSRIFEELEIDVVMCGHKHTYSFSNYVRERTVIEKINPDGNIASPEDITNGNYVEMEIVNEPVNPRVIKLTDVHNNYEQVIANNPDFKNYVLYIMSQATGYKLSSNVDVPATNISWLGSYYPGKDGGKKANPEQFYPSYVRYNVLPGNNGIQIIPYKITNIMVDGTQTFLPFFPDREPMNRISNFSCEGINEPYFTIKPKHV